MDDAAQEARRKKYGSWTRFLSDAEAEKIVHDYGDVAYLFKRIIEKVFGKKYSYSIVDCEGEYLEGFFCRIYPEGNTHLSEMGVSFANPTTIMAEAYLEYKGQLDCDFEDLLDEIYREVEDWSDFYDEEPWELALEGDGDYDPPYVACTVTIEAYHAESGHVFEDLPSVDTLDEYFERIKEIIDSHKKKTVKKGS